MIVDQIGIEASTVEEPGDDQDFTVCAFRENESAGQDTSFCVRGRRRSDRDELRHRQNSKYRLPFSEAQAVRPFSNPAAPPASTTCSEL